MKKILFLLLALPMLAFSGSNEKIKAVIITGQNNHNWEVSNVVLEQILENSGMFDCDVAKSPAKGEDFSNFNVNFSNYDVVVIDYNGDSWNDKMKSDFQEYVCAGGGVVIYHAGDNAFPNWPFFNQVIALGGWLRRTQWDGVYRYVVDGELITDGSAGPSGSHGKQHEYVLNGHDSKHPITKGLPKNWKHAQDELYDRMRGPGNIKSLLYSAYSDTQTKGSGREEPLLFTVDLGNARIFHTMLGHAGNTVEDNTAMQCTGFQVTLLRGAEWAATGKVTQKVPSDFPTATQSTMRPSYK